MTNVLQPEFALTKFFPIVVFRCVNLLVDIKRVKMATGVLLALSENINALRGPDKISPTVEISGSICIVYIEMVRERKKNEQICPVRRNLWASCYYCDSWILISSYFVATQVKIKYLKDMLWIRTK